MTNTENPTPGRVRASDVEREEYAKIVRTAMTEGRLDLEEGESRLAGVYGATYRDELAPLIADLPPSTAFNTPEHLSEAKHRLRAHTRRVVSVGALLTGIWLLIAILAHPVFFWPIIPIAIMSIGLARHRRWYRWQQRGGWGPWPASGWSGPGRGGPGWAGPGPGQPGPGWGGPGPHWHAHRHPHAAPGPNWEAGPCAHAR